MKKFTRILALLCIVCMMAVMAVGCNNNADSDLSYVKGKGKLIVGITDFAPMDYKDADGNWIGFDADLAKAFAEKLGVEAKFVEITWNQKANELKTKNIDVVWNGMTLTPDVQAVMDCSNAYCKNAQVVVMKKDVAAKYTTVDSMKDLRFAVEQGSAGAEAAAANNFEVTAVDKQAKALMEVSSGTCDAAIIDLLMAGAMIGEGTSYADLVMTVELNSEEYGIGFRQGSDLVKELNEFLVDAYKDGTITKLGETYGIAKNVIEQK
ncbi:MAG: transporter substrate-binding domain-containing protein [Clostridia bacterium]|nr:transporter substrate-binding domain-containing protein [Clostridia bacterium]